MMYWCVDSLQGMGTIFDTYTVMYSSGNGSHLAHDWGCLFETIINIYVALFTSCYQTKVIFGFNFHFAIVYLITII